MSAVFSQADHRYMARALQLAQKGLYTTDPNPRVGCVIVRDEQIVGEGFHLCAGEPHAEIHALNDAGEQALGATAYVTPHQSSSHSCSETPRGLIIDKLAAQQSSAEASCWSLATLGITRHTRQKSWTLR